MQAINPEHLILAWIFLKPARADEIFASLQSKHFAAVVNADAFDKAKAIHGKGQKADPFSVAQAMETDDSFNYLLSLCNIPVGQNLDAVIDAVKEQGAKTRLKVALESALLSMQESQTYADAYLNAKKAIDGLSDNETQDQDAQLMRELLPDYVAELQRRSSGDDALMGLSTGFRDLDKILNGLKPGNLIIVAGGPSMGKSTFALNIAQHNALKCGKYVVVFSMEMFSADITDKLVSADTGVFLNRIQSGEVVGDSRDMDKLTKSILNLKQSKLWLDTRGALTLDQLRSSCFRIKAKHGLDLVIVDYIGIMRGEGNGRYEQITSLSNGLQRLSRDLGIPVIVLSQLSRGVESRSDKRPVMSDLRESGAIEQDADVILFPYRDCHYDEKSRMKSGAFEVAEIIVAKNKMGKRETAYMIWQGSMSRFVDDNTGTDWKLVQAEKPKEENQKPKRGMI